MQTKRIGLCAVLSAAALLLLAGCAGSGSTAAPTLTVESSDPLQYAKQFTVDECTGGYELITIADSQYLVVPQGAAVPEDLPQPDSPQWERERRSGDPVPEQPEPEIQKSQESAELDDLVAAATAVKEPKRTKKEEQAAQTEAMTAEIEAEVVNGEDQPPV